jgi:hypothetical protein
MGLPTAPPRIIGEARCGSSPTTDFFFPGGVLVHKESG